MYSGAAHSSRSGETTSGSAAPKMHALHFLLQSILRCCSGPSLSNKKTAAMVSPDFQYTAQSSTLPFPRKVYHHFNERKLKYCCYFGPTAIHPRQTLNVYETCILPTAGKENLRKFDPKSPMPRQRNANGQTLRKPTNLFPVEVGEVQRGLEEPDARLPLLHDADRGVLFVEQLRHGLQELHHRAVLHGRRRRGRRLRTGRRGQTGV